MSNPTPRTRLTAIAASSRADRNTAATLAQRTASRRLRAGMSATVAVTELLAHGLHRHETPAPAPALTCDGAAEANRRPSFDYRLPSGEVIGVIHDHGDVPARTIRHQMADRTIVIAVLA